MVIFIVVGALFPMQMTMANKIDKLWAEYTQALFGATEETDRELYRRLLQKVKPDNGIRLENQDVTSPFDVLQHCESSTGVVEIKIRHKYTYEQFSDISVDTVKINSMLAAMDYHSATNAYLVAMYPKSDKAVIIDVTYIDYDEEDIEEREAESTSIAQYKHKKSKSFIPLSIHRGKGTNGTRAYVYSYPNLMSDYVEVFRKECAKRNIPEHISDNMIRDFIHTKKSQKGVL